MPDLHTLHVGAESDASSFWEQAKTVENRWETVFSAQNVRKSICRKGFEPFAPDVQLRRCCTHLKNSPNPHIYRDIFCMLCFFYFLRGF